MPGKGCCGPRSGIILPHRGSARESRAGGGPRITSRRAFMKGVCMSRLTPLLWLLVVLCTAAGPATRPATAPAKPKRVVFLLDSSGSMIDKFVTVRREARRRIDALAPQQSFVIVSMRFPEGTGNPEPSR